MLDKRRLDDAFDLWKIYYGSSAQFNTKIWICLLQSKNKMEKVYIQA